jgi:hypothetical protein
MHDTSHTRTFKNSDTQQHIIPPCILSRFSITGGVRIRNRKKNRTPPREPGGMVTPLFLDNIRRIFKFISIPIFIFIFTFRFSVILFNNIIIFIYSIYSYLTIRISQNKFYIF